MDFIAFQLHTPPHRDALESSQRTRVPPAGSQAKLSHRRGSLKTSMRVHFLPLQ